MLVQRLHLKNFRCFASKIVEFSTPITLIQGNNGSGKTSVLEALYYLCYLRSFRAHHTREMIAHGAQEFFLKAHLMDESDYSQHDLQVGFSSQKKLVKFDDRTINSFKELMDFYRVVALFEDDLALLQTGPETRRTFIDHALLLLNPERLSLFREYKKILDNRNALLHHAKGTHDNSYDVWTEQLWYASKTLAHERTLLLNSFQDQVNKLLSLYFEPDLSVMFDYKHKGMNPDEEFTTFALNAQHIKNQEFRFGRSLFGAHLDDYAIYFGSKQTRLYASRGQQKLVVALLKVAFLTLLSKSRGKTLFVLDDFMTDFDEKRIETLLSLLSDLNLQLIFTSPAQNSHLDQQLIMRGASVVNL